MRPGHLRTTLVALAASTALGTASADPLTSEPVRIDYRAPEGCPTSSVFAARVLARTPRVRIAQGSEAAATFVVILDSGSAGFHGRLLVPGIDGAETGRDITGNDCDEVASAVALILALTIDPNAAISAPLPLPPESEPTPIAPEPLPITAPLPGPVGDAKSRWSVSLGADATVTSIGISRPMMGGLVFADIGLEGTPPSPSLRLALSRSASGAIHAGAGVADFTQTLASLDVSPWRFVTASLSVAPFAGINLGVLHGDASGVRPSLHPTRPWVDLGAGARLGIKVYGPIAANLGAGLVVPFVRDSFYFAPSTSPAAFRADPVGFRGTVGIAARFP